MNCMRLCAKIVIITALVINSYSGPNENAQIVIDHYAATEEIEKVCNGTGDEVYAALKVNGVTDLAGFCVKVAYDTTQLKFVSATLAMDGSPYHSFLESQGGKKGPVMVIPKNGTVEIVAGIKTESREEAPDGDGTLAYLKFTRLGNNNSTLTIKKAELSNSDLIIDKLAVEE
jgi:hypothetical protein